MRELTSKVRLDRDNPGLATVEIFPERDLRLDFWVSEESIWLNVFGEAFFPPGFSWSFRLTHKKTDIRVFCDRFLRVWEEVVLGYFKSDPGYEGEVWKEMDPFRWSEFFPTIAGTLAQEGEWLLNTLFQGADPGLRARLDTALQGDSLVIAVTELDFSIPWTMMYSHPEAVFPSESESMIWHRAGFLGAKHVFDQIPWKLRPESDMPNAALADRLSMYIGSEFYDCDSLPAIHSDCQEIGVAVDDGISFDRLESLFANPRSAARIQYFYCHGLYGEHERKIPGLKIGERTIDNIKIGMMIRGQRFDSRPLFFLNCCYGGMLFHSTNRGPALELLNLGAGSVVGPLIRVPQNFAGLYGKSFLFCLLRDGKCVAEIARTLAGDFLARDNPLGLIYATYCGLRFSVPSKQVKAGNHVGST